MLVQWEDEDGNLYEVGVIAHSVAPHAYLKKWDSQGRLSATRGTHTILWQGGGQSVSLRQLVETAREIAVANGCPPERAIQRLKF